MNTTLLAIHTRTTEPRRPLRTAWCLCCDRALPQVRRGFCTFCHRGFNRSDHATFRREPLNEDQPNHRAAIATALLAAAVYFGWIALYGWVEQAIWQSEHRWPAGWLLLVSLRTWIVTWLMLLSLRNTGYDRIEVLWMLGIGLGFLLGLPYGTVAALCGMIVGMPAAIFTRAISLGIETRVHA
ncbi:MAG: hypothetical protein AAGH92_09160 [Planctomycetota bacterium]